jgi:hypothetical protein
MFLSKSVFLSVDHSPLSVERIIFSVENRIFSASGAFGLRESGAFSVESEVVSVEKMILSTETRAFSRENMALSTENSVSSLERDVFSAANGFVCVERILAQRENRTASHHRSPALDAISLPFLPFLYPLTLHPVARRLWTVFAFARSRRPDSPLR